MSSMFAVRIDYSVSLYGLVSFNKKNNNNFKTVFMLLSSWQSHCESSPGSFDECRTAPSGRRPKTKSDDLGCESACTGCQSLNPLSLFIIITQPESWYSFYHPIEVEGWVDLVGWLHTEMQHVFGMPTTSFFSQNSSLSIHGLPTHWRSPVLVLTRSGVAQTANQVFPGCNPSLLV